MSFEDSMPPSEAKIVPGDLIGSAATTTSFIIFDFLGISWLSVLLMTVSPVLTRSPSIKGSCDCFAYVLDYRWLSLVTFALDPSIVSTPVSLLSSTIILALSFQF